MSKWSEARDAQMVAEGWVKRPDGFWEHKGSKIMAAIEDSLPARPIPIYGTTEVRMPKIKRPRKSTKTLNQTEQRYKAKLIAKGIDNIREQSITLKLDPPFKSYRADLSYMGYSKLQLVEVKGKHRFRRAGIAKVALAAKTYPEFAFTLAEWDGKEWKETLL